MFRVLQSLVAGIRQFAKGRSPAATRNVRPQVEGMEERMVLSTASPLSHLHVVSQAKRLPSVPDFTNDKFVVNSLSDGSTHQLVIQSEKFTRSGANFTGIWDDGTIITKGQLASSRRGTHMTFQLKSLKASFDGFITDSEPEFHLDGRMKVKGGGGPGQLVGQENVLPDMTNVNFAMTSLTNGTSQQLLIQTQTLNADGSASITGLWGKLNNGGKPATGTLTLDANGNVHIVVSWNGNGTTPNPTGDHVFEATITGNAGSFHIDGQVTVAGGGGPGHVVGDQTP